MEYNIKILLLVIFTFNLAIDVNGYIPLSADYMSPQYVDILDDNYVDTLNEAQATYDMPLRMPSVSPKKKDTYFCYSYNFDNSKDEYIVGFRPNASMETAHHILLYGCTTPFRQPGNLWSCGEMAGNGDGTYPSGPTCAEGPQIVYAWARDAPKLDLPSDVGFKVGKTSEIKSIVLQVHYANVDQFLRGAVDKSGITLKITDQKQNKLAGVYLLGTGGLVYENVSHLEVECKINERNITMHPFAYRTHTHQHGKVVSGYRVRKGKWTKIGKKDPLKPQMFYPTPNKDIEIKSGDILAARCTMDNQEGHIIPIGATHKDEMCNFYMMYWAYKLSSQKFCFSNGLPMYKWKNDGKLSNIPLDASKLDPEDM